MADAHAPLDVNAPSKEMIENIIHFHNVYSTVMKNYAAILDAIAAEEEDAAMHRRATLVARAQDYAVPIPRPRAPYRRTARNGNGDAVGNKKWFRSWRGTYAVYEDLREPAYYSENIDADLVKRRELEHKIRLPYSVFYALYEEMKLDPFIRERSTAVPLKIKLIVALRFLALGSQWDGMEDAVDVSARTCRSWFYKKFIPWMMKNKYDAYVKPPTTSEEVAALMVPWTEAGFPGCIGCVDGTHLEWGGARAGKKYLYIGKEGYSTIGINVSVDYWGRIMFVSTRLPGSFNDKTLITFDTFHNIDLRENPIFTKQEFDLFDTAGNRMRERGVYMLADGGYRGWRTTVHAFTNTLPESWNAKWTRMHESLRKKVECAFGILKKRWRILHVESLCRDERVFEKVFKVCCCLHNIIHEEQTARKARGEAPFHVDFNRADEDEMRLVRNNGGLVPIRQPCDVRLAGNAEELRRRLVTHFQHHFTIVKGARGGELSDIFDAVDRA